MAIKNADRNYIEKVFEEAYQKGLAVTSQGHKADYIPELAKADENAFGICAMDKNGEFVGIGDIDTRFSMQSISKVLTLSAAIEMMGFDEVFSNVMFEPSGDGFNSIVKLDTVSNLPYNPMINAGAIQIASMLADNVSFDNLLDFAREFCHDSKIELNEPVYRSECETGDRNRAIAYLLKSKGVLKADIEKTCDLYFKMCSLNVTARSLAGMGLIISNDGVNPFTEKRYISHENVRTLKSIMFSCGMYDRSGEFSVKVGVPAKSGVGGGIVCAARGPLGIGIYGPALDHKGNSIAGVAAMEHISGSLNLHIFD